MIHCLYLLECGTPPPLPPTTLIYYEGQQKSLPSVPLQDVGVMNSPRNKRVALMI